MFMGLQLELKFIEGYLMIVCSNTVEVKFQ